MTQRMIGGNYRLVRVATLALSLWLRLDVWRSFRCASYFLDLDQQDDPKKWHKRFACRRGDSGFDQTGARLFWSQSSGDTLCRLSFPRPTSRQCKASTVLNLKTKSGGRSANTCSERATDERSSYSESTKSFVKNWRRRPAQAVFRAGTVSKKARMMTRKSSASHRSSRPKL
jgi:hypothetical protein